MTTRKWRRLLVPALTTLLMLVLACSLGVWQVERLAWKTRLLADVDRAETSPAIPLPVDPPAFAKVRTEGKWLPGYALYGADLGDTLSGPRMGARLIMALQPASGPPILVDRGWVPTERAGDISTPSGPVAVEGYIRRPEHAGLFAPQDDRTQHRFYTLDPAAIGTSLGLAQAAPFVLVSLGPAAAGVYPVPAQALPRPPNDHLSYAITWFGLGLTLVVIFLIYSRKVLRT
jgi:surfeit locus 1 family protein